MKMIDAINNVDRSEKMAVLVHTVRGGRDSTEFWHLITSELADKLPNDDIWCELPSYEEFLICLVNFR